MQNIHFKTQVSHFYSKTSLVTGHTGFRAKHTLYPSLLKYSILQYKTCFPESQDVRNDSTEYCFWQICVFPETTRTCWGSGTVAPSLASPAPVLMATASLSPPAIRTGQRNEVKQEKHNFFFLKTVKHCHIYFDIQYLHYNHI